MAFEVNDKFTNHLQIKFLTYLQIIGLIAFYGRENTLVTFL